MNPTCSSLIMSTVIFAHAALAGCTTGPFGRHKQHHPPVTDTQSPGAAESASSVADKPMNMDMDMNVRCQVHRDMMSARTQQERRAMMERHMKGMSPDMMQKHLDMMQEKCK